MDDTLGTILAIILGVNVVFFLLSTAIVKVNPDAANFYNCEGSIIGKLESQNCKGATHYLNDTDPAANLPSSQGSISPETGNIFTDIWTMSKNWLLEKTGLGYLLEILGGPSTLMKTLHFDPDLTFAIGVLWYGFTLFIIVSWARGT